MQTPAQPTPPAPQVAPYGTWQSPITAEEVAAGEALIEYVGFVGDEVWWVETRPQEQGRSALVRRDVDNVIHDVLGPEWNVRTRVIEYGGRPWLPLGADATAGVAFTHWPDQRVYVVRPDQPPQPISPTPSASVRQHYADFSVIGNELWCLRETLDEGVASRDLVALPLDGSAAQRPERVRLLAASHHFMTGPKVSPDGRHVVWLGWDHPNMPWDTTDLMCAPVAEDGTVGLANRLAGGAEVSIGQVEWSQEEPDTLLLLTDPDGWWNIHTLGLNGATRNLCQREEEFGEALWRIGARWFLPGDNGRLFVVHGTSDRRLAVLERDGSLREIGDPYTEWAALATDGTVVAGTAGNPWLPRTVVLVEPDGPRLEVVRPAELGHARFQPQGYARTFHGPAGETVHAFVHPPHNPDFTAPDGELPPYLVHVHGGPTNRSQLVVHDEFALFTSRGFGIIDVQYGGSTGHGREYRNRLRGNWGIVDVADCAIAVNGLVAAGLADPNRIAIRGGSAGGWTAVASLGEHPDLYRVAAISFPVLDPISWRVHGTHDFESRYLDSLVGPWPQAKDRYEQVSPLRRAHRIRSPFLLMQGLEDEICPPEQARLLLAELRDHDVEHTYLTFQGEQHGFRKADTIRTCLEAELALYATLTR